MRYRPLLRRGGARDPQEVCVSMDSFQLVADFYYSESKAGMSQVYEQILKVGQAKKRCTACNRDIHNNEMAGFEKYVCVIRVPFER